VKKNCLLFIVFTWINIAHCQNIEAKKYKLIQIFDSSSFSNKEYTYYSFKKGNKKIDVLQHFSDLKENLRDVMIGKKYNLQLVQIEWIYDPEYNAYFSLYKIRMSVQNNKIGGINSPVYRILKIEESEK